MVVWSLPGLTLRRKHKSMKKLSPSREPPTYIKCNGWFFACIDNKFVWKVFSHIFKINKIVYNLHKILYNVTTIY